MIQSITPPIYDGPITKVFKSQLGLTTIYNQYEADLMQWPVTYTEQYIDSEFGRTYCLMSGKAENPPLVLLHGLGVNTTSFYKNIEQLSQHYRVYLLDFPGGAGRSIPSKLMLKKRDVGAWLNHCISQIEHRKVTILGTSFGSWVATKYALKYDDRVTKLILISPPPLAGKSRLTFRLLFKMIALGLKKSRENMYQLCQLLSHYNNKPAEQIVTAVYNGLKYTKSFKESGFTLNKKETQALKVPIQFIFGESDFLCDMNSLASHFTGAEFSIIKNAGHMVNIEQSQQVNDLIIATKSA